MNATQRLNQVSKCLQNLPADEQDSVLADILWEIYDDAIGEVLEEHDAEQNH